MYDTSNIFAKILREEIPCQKVFENSYALAFHDITPKAPVHILVIPKGEYVNFHKFHEKASPEFIAHFYQSVSQIIVQEKLGDLGYRVITNTGAHGGQEVPHFHLHILAGHVLGALVGD